MTRTYTIMEVSAWTYQEIMEKLEAAGYDHAIFDHTLDMHGIALQTEGSSMEHVFSVTFASTAEEVYNNAKAKGFWEGFERGILTVDQVGLKLALIHSEISEALEAARDAYPASKKIPEIGNFEEELADAVIRIMDLGHSMELDVGSAIIKKMAFNKGRPHMHGKTA